VSCQFTTDGPSVSMSWCRAPSGAHDQMVCSLARRVADSYPLSASRARSNGKLALLGAAMIGGTVLAGYPSEVVFLQSASFNM
jgi:hypothetical protein